MELVTVNLSKLPKPVGQGALTLVSELKEENVT